jgi:hypothetical protein
VLRLRRSMPTRPPPRKSADTRPKLIEGPTEPRLSPGSSTPPPARADRPLPEPRHRERLRRPCLDHPQTRRGRRPSIRQVRVPCPVRSRGVLLRLDRGRRARPRSHRLHEYQPRARGKPENRHRSKRRRSNRLLDNRRNPTKRRRTALTARRCGNHRMIAVGGLSSFARVRARIVALQRESHFDAEIVSVVAAGSGRPGPNWPLTPLRRSR